MEILRDNKGKYIELKDLEETEKDPYENGNNDFVESHTGLEDVLIEKEIFAKCMAQHKKMRKNVWE